MNELIRSDIGGSVTLDQSALAERDQLLTESNVFCQQVTNADEQKAAAQFGIRIQLWLREVESARAFVKRPLITLSNEIERLADEAKAPVLAEKNRLARMCSQYQVEENERVRREEAERARKIREAQEVADLAVLEAARKEAGMESDAQLSAAIVAAQEAQLALDVERAVIVAAPPAVNKAVGAVVKKVVKFEVTNIHSLYLAAPHLVRTEPNLAAIRACVTASTNLPGLRVWEEVQTQFRS